MLRHLKDIKAKIEQKSIHNMKLPFEGPFKNKYAGRSPERILCLYSVRLVFRIGCCRCFLFPGRVSSTSGSLGGKAGMYMC